MRQRSKFPIRFEWLKYGLTQIGARLSANTLHHLQAMVNYLEVGRWMRARGFTTANRVDRRHCLFDMIGRDVGDRRVLYLEFGVFQGNTTRYFSKLLSHPDSRLHGFDSFEGLPEGYLPHRPPGHFSLDGQMPDIPDPRVRFFKGWFEDTLPGYECPPHDVLVLNCDADLYSSTMFVLRTLAPRIVPGTYVYFDEFYDARHELRAFSEFLDDTGMQFRLVGATRTLQHVLFQRVG